MGNQTSAVLVTGGAGYVGSHACSASLASTQSLSMASLRALLKATWPVGMKS